MREKSATYAQRFYRLCVHFLPIMRKLCATILKIIRALFANYAHLFRFCITHECTFENYNIRISIYWLSKKNKPATGNIR